MRPSLFRYIATLWACASLTWSGYASPPVKVRLRSSWPAPNILLEILESAYMEHNDAFFPLLDILTSSELLPDQLASSSSQAIYDTSVRALLQNGYLSEPGAKDTFNLSLALHSTSPKIEAYYQYYRDRDLEHTPLADGETVDRCTGSWIEWKGRRVCSVDTFRRLIEFDSARANVTSEPASFERTKLLSFDHVSPAFEESSIGTATLYGDIGSPNFRPLHNYVYSLSKETPPRLRYIFRYLPSENGQVAQSYLAGYGVTLDLKKMDYLALDDRKPGSKPTTALESEDEQEVEVDNILSFPDDLRDVDLVTALTGEEISSIPVKATQLIMSSPDPLQALTHLSQNFPKYAISVARRVVPDDALSNELQGNWNKIPQGFNAAWLNGMVLQNSDVNIFGLIRLLRKERTIIGHFTKLGLTATQAVDLLTHDMIISSQGGSPVTEGVFDASDRREGGDTILWWNDLEKDRRYAQWSPSLQGMLRPVYPGQFHHVKRNLFNTVLVLDLSQRSSLGWITNPVANIIQRGFPFRFGVVPIVETEEGIKAARLFYYLVKVYGRSKTLNYMKMLVQTPGPTVDFKRARAEFEALVADTDNSQGDETKSIDFDTVIGSTKSDVGEELDLSIVRARAYSKRLGTSMKSSSQGHAFINGKYAVLTDDFLNVLQTETGQQTQYLQEQIFLGNLTEEADASLHFYDLPTTAASRNGYIYPTAQAGSLRVAILPEVFARTDEITSTDFVYSASTSHPILSMLIVADFDQPLGALLLRESLQSLEGETAYRVAFVHNPAEGAQSDSNDLSVKLSLLRTAGLLNTISPATLLTVLDEWSDFLLDDNQVVLDDTMTLLRNAILATHSDTAQTIYANFCRSSRLLAKELGILAGQRMIVVNGRFVGPLGDDDFGSEDFRTLASYEISKRAGPIVQAYTNVTGMELDIAGTQFPDDFAKLSSVITSVQIPDPSAEGLFNVPQRQRNRRYLLLDHWKTSISFGNNATASYQLAFIVDPLSELASRWSSLISWLSSLEYVSVQVYLNPVSAISELPLKQFYRLSLPSRLSFDSDGLVAEVLSTIHFGNLPPDPIYTLGMDVPPAWLVRPHESHHDLDNIHIASFTGADKTAGVEAVFSLDYLVVEGHARESNTNTPPRGLQLQLSTSNSTPIADTQVVANLGYLQFKVKPGVFKLEIREGHGREIFDIESVGNEGWNSPPVTSAGTEITLTSLEGLTLYPRFRNRPGMEGADVLLEHQQQKASTVVDQVVAGISSIFGPKKEVQVTDDQAEINIFTVASGLLYERFVSIMILSVLRNTKSTVKFWFIENFLSPSFLEFIPHLAEAYNFQYELVTYKWPSWLREQKEKQRIIWGYKILFLDVLFPMDLKKVIFVDADQIVRADLKELVDLDLNGAPYGYTPMGNDNVEMEGFRFWKTGYWKEFLREKPYHISALYVIDLIRFRQLAAGDRLRGSYQALSADPGSLANLDQDLPNNLQHEVPIFSLPEDWLWCETWCTKDRLHRAKTIDLCQNPLTKEPKLARARQIPEWEEYDNEISQFARMLAENGAIRSDAYTSGADALANVGTKASPVKPPHEEGQVDTTKVETEQIVASDSLPHDEL
ncbi:UDP-glucose:Glycoprotein glucosyltransferase-domain-containing protein [Hysterangium stoloniferum]|nr:UDP-glucose:Glycoprotein glucosyltransferase-domain-containing protein [Hysterangium stoloniferum]